VNPALIRAAARAYRVSQKGLAAVLELAPTVDRAWAAEQGFLVEEYDQNSDANRANLAARALACAAPGILTTQIADAARQLGHTPKTLDVWRARWWRARSWPA
jgi:hypothetical protein